MHVCIEWYHSVALVNTKHFVAFYLASGMQCTKAKVYGWHLVAPSAPKAETSKPKHGLKWTELTLGAPVPQLGHKIAADMFAPLPFACWIMIFCPAWQSVSISVCHSRGPKEQDPASLSRPGNQLKLCILSGDLDRLLSRSRLLSPKRIASRTPDMFLCVFRVCRAHQTNVIACRASDS